MDSFSHFQTNLAELMRLRHDLTQYKLQRVSLTLVDYDQLLVDLLSVTTLQIHSRVALSALPYLNQSCDQWGYTKNTKFLAKTLFDLTLTRLPAIDIHNAPLYLLSALRIAVKFNQTDFVSSRFTVDLAVEVEDGRFQHEQFIKAELDILRTVGFRMHLVSPYDYLQLVRPVLRSRLHDQAKEKRLEILLDFGLSLPQLTLCPSQHLFLACFGLIYPREQDLFKLDGMADSQLVIPVARLIQSRFERLVRPQHTSDFNN